MKPTDSAAAERFHPSPDRGLSEEQAAQRREDGLCNRDSAVKTKSIGRIVRDNVFTLFNLVVAVLAAAILAVGSYKNLLFAGVAVCNLVIGIVQEIRAKRVIDRLSLLSASRVHILRDGKDREAALSDIVLDDVLLLSRGSQIPVDCEILAGEADVNESLLTGEPDAIHKKTGDTLLSGSFIVSGAVRVRADKIGSDTYVSAISSEAKKPSRLHSEITDSLRRLIKIISIVIFPLGALLFWKQMRLPGISFADAVVSTSAALIGMIPSGLMLLTSMVLAMSVLRLVQKKVMVQELTCIESLARVDMLCLDKTGTITEGSMELQEAVPLQCPEEEVTRALQCYCTCMEDDTETFRAIAARYAKPGSAAKPGTVIPFSSDKKWSGLSWNGKGSLLLGAPEFILGENYTDDLRRRANALAAEGRVMLFAGSRSGFQGRSVPSGLLPIAFIVVRDTIRSNAADTLHFFAEQGVAIKVISGDNPVTVSAIARRVGLAGADSWVDASALADEDIAAAAAKYTVFGRVTPHQKKKLIQALQAAGHTVAMTGDGVNDVLALKEADCSIAMASGSDAARNVSHLVLLHSDFSALPDVVYEGRRSINNLQRSASLFLVKTGFSILLALIFMFLTLPYPFEPIQLTLISSFMIGIPSFILAMEPNKNRVRHGFLRHVVRESAPGALTIGINIAVLSLIAPHCGFTPEILSTLCVLSTSFTGLLILWRLCHPFTRLRAALYIFILSGISAAVLLLPKLFSLVPLFGPGFIGFAAFGAAAASFAFCTALYLLFSKLFSRIPLPEA